MIIDFHTHVFPDKLAPKAQESLLKACNNVYKPTHNMTISGLIETMDKCRIDKSVTQPVITKQSQFKTTNDWAKSIESDRIIPFGGLYPHTDDYKRDIDYIVSLGLKGIKLHAEYQNFVVDDPKMLKIYDYAFSKGLIILHHGGADPAFPPPYKTSPERFAHIVDEMKGGIMVVGHFGGHAQWDDVEKYLVGKNVYLDTSMGFEYYSEEQFVRIVRAHGADKILFATDSPWSNAKNEIEKINKSSLSKDEKQKILGKNATKILELC